MKSRKQLYRNGAMRPTETSIQNLFYSWMDSTYRARFTHDQLDCPTMRAAELIHRTLQLTKKEKDAIRSDGRHGWKYMHSVILSLPKMDECSWATFCIQLTSNQRYGPLDGNDEWVQTSLFSLFSGPCMRFALLLAPHNVISALFWSQSGPRSTRTLMKGSERLERNKTMKVWQSDYGPSASFDKGREEQGSEVK